MSRRAGIVLAGDVVALVVFAVLGRRSHDEAAGLAAAAAIAGTAAPFLVGWLASTAARRTFREMSTMAVPTVVRSTWTTWVLAFPVAVVLRALFLGRLSPWTFYVVAFLVPLLFLIAWHVTFAVLSGARTTRRAEPHPR